MKKKCLILPITVLSLGLLAGCDLETIVNSDSEDIEQAVQKVASDGYEALQNAVGEDVLAPINDLRNSVIDLANTDIEDFSASEVIVFDTDSINSLLQGIGGIDGASFDKLPDSIKGVLDTVVPATLTEIVASETADSDDQGSDATVIDDTALDGALKYTVDGVFDDQSWILVSEAGEDVIVNFTNIGDSIVSVSSQYIDLPSGEELEEYLSQFVDVDNLQIIDLGT